MSTAYASVQAQHCQRCRDESLYSTGRVGMFDSGCPSVLSRRNASARRAGRAAFQDTGSSTNLAVDVQRSQRAKPEARVTMPAARSRRSTLPQWFRAFDRVPTPPSGSEGEARHCISVAPRAESPQSRTGGRIQRNSTTTAVQYDVLQIEYRQGPSAGSTWRTR
jgi:hypothetical protein